MLTLLLLSSGYWRKAWSLESRHIRLPLYLQEDQGRYLSTTAQAGPTRWIWIVQCRGWPSESQVTISMLGCFLIGSQQPWPVSWWKGVVLATSTPCRIQSRLMPFKLLHVLLLLTHLSPRNRRLDPSRNPPADEDAWLPVDPNGINSQLGDGKRHALKGDLSVSMFVLPQAASYKTR